jgi:hypothetical protein
MIISLCAGFLTALAALPFLATAAVAGYRWTFLLIPLLVAGLHPRVLNPAVDRLLRLARRPALEQRLTGRTVATALGWALAAWILLGAQIWVLAVRLDAPPARTVPLAIGGFALAWGAGFLVILAPAGVGVRDLLLVAALGPVLSVGPATAVALMSRILMTAGDLVLAAVAAGRSGSRGWSGDG